jgi:menaquinone-dependent protoporphyrinogen oxidase
MDKQVLIAYASKYGSTKEIAESIGGEFQKAGLQVDVLPVTRVQHLTSYQAVVLGSAIYIGKWQKEAVSFLEANKNTLASQKVWLFSSGPTGAGDPDKLLDGKVLPKDVQKLMDLIHPQNLVVFHGNIDAGKINFMERFAVKNIVKKPFGDFRDWNEIPNSARTILKTLLH